MRKLLFITLFFSGLCFFTARSQDYKFSIGARGGFSGGVTLKYFTDVKPAFEFIANARWKGYIITGLYEYHFPMKRSKSSWKGYIGAGPHMGMCKNPIGHPWFVNAAGTQNAFGLDVVIGTEYTFFHFPAVIGIDWRPGYNIFGSSGLKSSTAFLYDEVQAFIRYAIKW